MRCWSSTTQRCRRRAIVRLVSLRNGQLPNIGVADACARRSAGDDGIASLPSRDLDERCGAFEAWAGVPVEHRAARTKPEIALAEIDRVIAAGVRFGCVLADAVTASAHRSVRGSRTAALPGPLVSSSP
jgi:hypothetical protein